jgi:hypothetical protein
VAWEPVAVVPEHGSEADSFQIATEIMKLFSRAMEVVGGRRIQRTLREEGDCLGSSHLRRLVLRNRSGYRHCNHRGDRHLGTDPIPISTGI